MAMHQIAKITFEAEIKTHPQMVTEEFDFKASRWRKEGRIYVKGDDLSRYTLQKTDKKLFILTIEQLDLFRIEPGKWNENNYPERENLIDEALIEIEREFKSKINILKIDRVAI